MEGHIIGKPSFDQKSKLERNCRVAKSVRSNICKKSPFLCLAGQNSHPNFENPDKCWHSKEFRFIYDPLHYLRTKKCHFGSGFTRLIYYPLKSNGNFSWNINRFMWNTLHFRPIHVTHNSYEKEFSIVPFYIHYLLFYHHAIIFIIQYLPSRIYTILYSRWSVRAFPIYYRITSLSSTDKTLQLTAIL